MDVETRHRTFSPFTGLGLSVLDAICTDMERDGWELVRVVVHHQFESVAVFQRVRKKDDNDQHNSGTYL